MVRRKSLVAVVASAACFGTLAILTDTAYAEQVRLFGHTSPLTLLTWRFALVSVLMAGLQVMRDPRSLAVTTGDIARFGVLSLTGYGFASVCFFFALTFAPVSVVAVLLYTYPAIVSAVSVVLFRERVTWHRLAAVAFTFIGCALVLGVASPAAGHVRLPGVLLGVGAAVGYSVFNLASYQWMSRRPRAVLMTYTFGLSALGIGVLTVATGDSLSVAGWTPLLWGMLAAIVLVPTFLAVVLYLQGMRGLGASQAAVVSTFEPLFTIALAALILGERLAPVQLLGAAFVLGGVVLAEWGAQTVRPEEVAAV